MSSVYSPYGSDLVAAKCLLCCVWGVVKTKLLVLQIGRVLQVPSAKEVVNVVFEKVQVDVDKDERLHPFSGEVTA